MKLLFALSAALIDQLRELVGPPYRIVREVLEIHDFESDPASGNSKDA